MTIGRVVRFGAPVVFAVLLVTGLPKQIPLTYTHIQGTAIGVLALAAVATMRWPRLWVLAPGLLITRIALERGAPDWVSWVQYTATMQMAIPLILIGVTSAVRRLPSPVPNAPGTIVPNADGIGALLALPVVLGLAITERFAWLYILSLLFAAYRAFDYNRKNQLWSRGRGWLAFLAGLAGFTAYAFYWARPDWMTARYFAAQGGPMFGILFWAVLRAVLPWRNTTTVP